MLTHGIYQNAFDWEYRQIAVDNSGILLGQSERDAFRYLARMNRRLRLLEKAHHVAHACARVPQPTPACLSADRTFEIAIRVLRSEAWVQARIKWLVGARNARNELRAFKTLGNVSQDPTLPVQSQRCPICGLEVYWEKTSDEITADIDSPGPPWLGVRVKLIGDSLTGRQRWDYRLESLEGSDPL